MWEKLFFNLTKYAGKSIGKKAGSIGGRVIETPVPHTSIASQIKELANDELVSKEYLHKLIGRANSKEQLGRLLHYLDTANTNNLTNYEWSDLRSFVMERFRDIKLNELLGHTVDLILLHLF